MKTLFWLAVGVLVVWLVWRSKPTRHGTGALGWTGGARDPVSGAALADVGRTSAP